MQIAEGSPVWQATIIKAAVYQAFFDHYRGLADKADEEMRQRFNDERFTEAQRDMFASKMAFEAMEYFHSQIDQAMLDAARLVMFETFNRLAALAVKSSGGGDYSERRAAISRGKIEEKAAEFLRKRLETTPFRESGRVGEWTPHELRIAVLDAMAQIEQVKYRKKWRVAGLLFGEDPKTRGERQAITTRLNSLLDAHSVDYAELEEVDDRKRNGKGN